MWWAIGAVAAAGLIWLVARIGAAQERYRQGLAYLTRSIENDLRRMAAEDDVPAEMSLQVRDGGGTWSYEETERLVQIWRAPMLRAFLRSRPDAPYIVMRAGPERAEAIFQQNRDRRGLITREIDDAYEQYLENFDAKAKAPE